MENKELLLHKKTAIFAYSDMLAIGIFNACKDLKLAIPEHIQIIGMDDILLATTINPQLSTLHVSVEEMVPRGCRLLIDLIDKKDECVQEWIKPKLILRGTTLELQ